MDLSSLLMNQRVAIGSNFYFPASAIAQVAGGEEHWDSQARVWSLTIGSHEVRCAPEMPLLLVDGTACPLSPPAVMKGNQLLLPETLWSQYLSQWARPVPRRVPSVPSGRRGTIVLDPGHGGNDPGATGRGGLREKNVTLDVALRLRDLLSQDGFRVIMTRQTDRFIPLSRRSQIANQSGADLFVSIHVNSSRRRSVSGFEVYYLSEATDDHARAIEASENEDLPGDVGSSSPETEAIVWDLLYTEHRAESSTLASRVSQGLKKELPTRNRGIKSARFAVLKGSRMPAVLVEVGFVSHPLEEARLRSPAYRQRLADGIRDGILLFRKNEQRA